MPKQVCQYRKRPSDDLSCGVMPLPGETMCPRHIFLAKLDETQERAKEVERRLKGQKKPSSGPMPNTREGLLKGGYLYTGTGACSGCGEIVEWWLTPNQRRAPFNRMPFLTDRAISHFATCTQANSFRRQA